MREIKFRAYCKVSKDMFPVLSLFLDEAMVQTDNDEYSVYDINNFELMQYTGLKDTNSNEIYHGDIVRLFDSQEAWGDVDGEFVKLPTYTDVIVVWSQIDLGWRAKYMHCSNLFSSNWDCYSMEVIGNIYENPELLKFKE